MRKVPFAQRFGFDDSQPIDNDFPPTARFALTLLLEDLIKGKYVESWYAVERELVRLARQPIDLQEKSGMESIEMLVQHLDWTQIYTFCERVYVRLLTPVQEWFDGDLEEIASLEQTQEYYTQELNNLLAEEHLAYEFVSGEFQRPGRPQTQKNIQRAGPVLADPRLQPVRLYFLKAQAFFNKRPDPDTQNCVKEAICALEAAVEILTDKPASKDFTKAIKQLQGGEAHQIPPPIAEAMIKVHSYRGAAQGVAHAALHGNSVTKNEAELVLSLVAAFITYLYDLFPEEEEALPF
jgi:hypothetical protein